MDPFRTEKKHKEQAIENAQRVASWTKKIMIERMPGSDFLLAPEVRIEKVRMEKSKMKDYEDTCDAVSEYEFPEDSDWEYPRELLELKEVLGEGTFGKVVRAYGYCTALKEDIAKYVRKITTLRVETKENVRSLDGNLETVEPRGELVIAPSAVKRPAMFAVKMLKEGHTDAEMIDFVKEMEMMKMIGKHINIINLLGVCTQPVGQQLLVIVEYAEHGNLRDFLRARSPQRGGCNLSVSLREMLSFGWQVGRGMQWLYNQKCVHRDLAARNVLVCADGVVKIADFGLARDLSDTEYYR